jgi:hypothetical protein
MIRRLAFGFVLFAAVMGALLAYWQKPFVPASFAYGVFERRVGVVEMEPYPVLRQGARITPLVAQGKFGADVLLREWAGRSVELETSLIRRGDRVMWEVSRVLGQAENANDPRLEWELVSGPLALQGEIVDSKCWLGVMQPGAGRVHRECAYRCLRGGVPPLFVAANGETYWMVDARRGAMDRRLVAELAGLRVRLRGNVWQRGKQQYVAVDVGSLVRE